MPYAVKCFPVKDAGVILCKDEDELAEVNVETAWSLGFSLSDAMDFGIESTIWIDSDAPTFSRFPITIYRISEEEYEKWQKAF